MSHIELDVRNFPPRFQHIHRFTGALPLSRGDIARGIVTAGRENWGEALKGGWARIKEIFHLCLGVAAYVDMGSDGLAMCPEFQNLDQSEKTAVSYRLGMGVAKIVIERTLRVPWLLHIDKLLSTGTASLHPGSRRRGDLAGPDQNLEWHVVEAKGRSRAWSQTLVNTAKSQAAQVVRINSQIPATNSACCVNVGRKPFYVLLDDPPPEPKDARRFKLEVNLPRFFQDYYSLSIGLGKAHELRPRKMSEIPGNPTFMGREIDGTDGWFGLHEEIYWSLLEDGAYQFRRLQEWSNRWLLIWERYHKENKTLPTLSVGLDGHAFSGDLGSFAEKLSVAQESRHWSKKSEKSEDILEEPIRVSVCVTN